MHTITANASHPILDIEESDDVTSLTFQVLDQIAAETFLSGRDLLTITGETVERLLEEITHGSYGSLEQDDEAIFAVGVLSRLRRILASLEGTPRYERERYAPLSRWVEILDEEHYKLIPANDPLV